MNLFNSLQRMMNLNWPC